MTQKFLPFLHDRSGGGGGGGDDIGVGEGKELGHVASLIRFHTNGLKPFERTIKQTTESMPP